MTLDADGNLLWAKRGGGEANETPRAVAELPDDTLVVVGSFRGLATFGEGADEITLQSEGPGDAFIATFKE